jgi:hypothetical protein
MKHKTLSELETIAAAHKRSLARFGDGELRLAIGGACSSQRADKKLAGELRRLLTESCDTLVGIPNFAKTPNRETWTRYAAHPYDKLYKLPTYGSAFITRPDNAPWIDTPDYWDAVRGLWAGKLVTLVLGDRKSLTPDMIEAGEAGGTVKRVIEAQRTHAYADVDAIQEEIGTEPGLVLMCLGATATVLARRLDDKGVHALDLGHIGMFMRHAGAYAFKPDDLATKGHRASMQRIPWEINPRADTVSAEVFAFAMWELEARTVLDYGSGSGWLEHNIHQAGAPGMRVSQYDIVKGRDALPKPADLVVGLDVLNWVEPSKRWAVLSHMCALAKKGVYLNQPDPAGEIAADIQTKVRELKNWRARVISSNEGVMTAWLSKQST